MLFPLSRQYSTKNSQLIIFHLNYFLLHYCAVLGFQHSQNWLNNKFLMNKPETSIINKKGNFSVQKLSEPLHPSGIQLHRIWCHYVLLVGSYRRSNNGLKWCLQRLRCCISRGTFETESPNITGTSMLTCPIFATDMTSRTTSARKLQRKKTWKMPLQVQFLETILCDDPPNFTRLSGITGPTNLLDMTSLVASDQLQHSIKYWTNVMRKTGLAGQRVK